MKHGILKHILGLVLCLAGHAQAGGPLIACSGVPVKYAGAGTITLNYDQGNLGSRSKVQADALVTEAVSLWTNVSTSTVTLARGSDLPVNVTTANYSTYKNNSSDGLNPVIYDSDGSIIDMLYGVGAKKSTLGFAGSGWYEYATYCEYSEGSAVINGYATTSDAELKITLAHEIGHLIGLDHTQLDSSQGLTSSYPSNYPLMYPIAYRDTLSLHEDDAAAVSALYPESNLSSVYGQLSGTFTQTGGTPIRGANLWAKENTSHQLFSIVSDYLMQNTGYFELLLPAGTYTLHAEAVQTDFSGGSSVGPYSGQSSDPSFQPPLYAGGIAMTPVALGSATPTQIAIVAGCAATVAFKLDGSGTVSGNCDTTCSYTLGNTSQSAAATGLSGTITVSSTTGCAWTAVSNASWITVTSGSSGSGNGTVAYSVATNTSSTSRSGTLTIGGQTFTVSQAGSTETTCTPGADTDGDGIPDCVELTEGTNPVVKDNDIFANARLFVMQQYRDFLAREGDSGEITAWTNAISGGTYTQAQVIDGFFNSSEFQGVASPVVRLYFAYFLRIPDYAGLQAWLSQYRAGVSLDSISNSFANSPEFLARYGALDNGGFVTLIYNNVLGRTPDTAGYNAWLAQLDSGAMTRGQVMLGFSESAEYQAMSYNSVYVTMMYMGMLQRSPEQAGFDAWVANLNAGMSSLDLINGFIAAPEYRGRFL